MAGTKILAGAAEFFYAARVADVGVLNDQVRRLVFFVLGAGVVEVGELVEGKLAVALGGAEQMSFVAAIGGQFARASSCAGIRQWMDSGRAGRVRR